MRKIVFAVLSISILSMFLYCTKNYLGNDINTQNLNEEVINLNASQLKFRKECAPIHSLGLDYFYYIACCNNTRAELSESNTIEIINNFMAQEDIRKIIQAQNLLGTRSGDSEIDKNKIRSLLLEFSNTCNPKSFLKSIDEFMGLPKVKKLSISEQERLFISLCIYEDSFNYWSKSTTFQKWDELTTKMNRIKTRSFWDDWGNKFKDAFQKAKAYAIKDAQGGIAGGIAGATGGAVAGTLAGGAGALPAAGAAGLVGAVTCAVYESIMMAFNSSGTYVIVKEKDSLNTPPLLIP